MRLKLTKLDVWTTEIDDKPGGLARSLRAITDFGVDLEGVVARRHPDKPGKGILYVTPATGHVKLEDAPDAALRRAPQVVTLKIDGTNSPGMGAKITRLIGDAGVSMHGLTAAVIGRKFVCFVGFDTVSDMDKAILALEPLTKRHWPVFGAKKKEEKVKIPA